MVRNSGLELVRLEKGPRAFGYMFEGVAANS
jgi:hypothetical protein